MRLIDTDELIKDIKHMAFTSDLTTTCAVGMARDWIENAPTIEPKKGRWIDTDKCDSSFYRCSECGRRSDWKDNFCPNCGVKMDN